MFLILSLCTLSIALASFSPQENYRVSGLDKFTDSNKYDVESAEEFYSGFIPLSPLAAGKANEEGNIFFFLAKQRMSSRRIDEQQENLVVWLNGG